jgi:cell division protein FtsI/penicillin-binding protein 2
MIIRKYNRFSLFSAVSFFLLISLVFICEASSAFEEIRGNEDRRILNTEMHDGAAVLVAELRSLKVCFIRRDNIILEKRLPFGSLIKPFTLYYAISKGVIDDRKVYLCEPSLPTDPAYSRCWYMPGHGRLNCVRALAVSCNRFFYKLSQKLEYDDYISFLAEFGFDAENVKGVEDPIGRSKIMVGLEDLLVENPSSLAFRLAAFFERGVIYRAVDLNKIVIDKIVPLNENNAEIVRKGMRLGAIDGTSAPDITERLSNLNLWSKTGTIGNCGELNKNAEELNNGLYFAYFRKTLKRYVILVIIPGGKGSDAAMVGREIILRLDELE